MSGDEPNKPEVVADVVEPIVVALGTEDLCGCETEPHTCEDSAGLTVGLDDLPDELPATPAGYHRKMVTHLNLGREGHRGVYEIRDPNGTVMPFTQQYDTGGKGKKARDAETGFYIDGLEAPLTWARLRNAYRVFMAGVKYAKERR